MPDTARTIEEGGYVDLESPLWPDQGVWPTKTADFAYAPYEEPGAGTDNKANYAVTYDHGQLNLGLGELDARLDSVENELANLDSRLDELEQGYNTHNHDTRYYTKTQADDAFVDESGDTMTGPLTIDPGGDTYQTFDGGNSDYIVALEDNHGRVSHLWNAEPGTHNVLDDNEGSAWMSVNGGHINMEVADGTPNDAGSQVDWTRVLELRSDGAKLNEGAEFGSSVDLSGHQITNVSKQTFNISSGDALIFNDATGGSTNHPFDVHYNGRNFRLSHDDGITAQFNQDGSTSFLGPVTLKGFQQTLQIGENAGGPHTLQFGDESGDGLRVVMRTSPDHLAIERPNGATIGYFDGSRRAADFSDSTYVALPVRGGPPADAPSGATWIEV